ncbi:MULTISPECIES: intermembrane transport protein PqiB [Pseudomonadaceae]|uniref:PqiB family protein n=1 Tax=Pseudomonadaceae TaxID=135621 RepID=UPI0015E3A595|nr:MULTISPECIES: MlaD family protein [Pseudomonadaceae]MBA1277177.1 MCE family protein [Stutzerimonas stutzeri]MBC8650647.1 MCE family protein [Pseudomonas sp. MT4]QXY91579.1 MCE family protein [Pseudomonas sp. MTM4]
MSDNPHHTESPAGTPEIRHRPVRVSLVWLVPIAAALVGFSMVMQNWLSAGPQITVSFETAEGLEANKTQVKYKNVVIGQVTAINLSEDHTRVIATVELDQHAEPFTREDTKFWVVRPRIGASGVSGVDTLLSGAFIGADAGRAEETRREFLGLEAPPPVTFGAEGKQFTLRSDNLGSLGVGSPLYFRRLQVGQVISFGLADDGKGVQVQVFVNAPYDRFVTDDTRFWNASGVDVSVAADGLRVNAESLSTILAGGIAFRAPNYSPDASPAAPDSEFTLFADVRQAMAPADGPPRYVQMRFDQTLRGLNVDAPVEFLGVPIGRVVSVKLDYDEKNKSFPAVVGAVIYPSRLGAAHDKLSQTLGGDTEEHTARLMQMFVDRGLRAQARTGNLLTGQLYISLDFDPRAPKVAFDQHARPMVIPTTAGSFDKLQEQLQAMVDKLSKLPIESLADNLNGSLDELRQTLKQVNGDVLPQLQRTLERSEQTLQNANQALAEDSPQRQQLGDTLDEVQRAVRSVRTLSDYISRHPESLIRGRSGDETPANYKGQATSRELNSEHQP